MLKLIIFFVSITICFGMPPNTFNLDAYQATIFKMSRDTIYANATDAEFNHFKMLVDNANKCWKSKAQQLPIFETPRQEFIRNIQKCYDNVINELKDRYPEGSKDLPQRSFDFLFAIIRVAYDYKDTLLSPEFRLYAQNCYKTQAAKFEFNECINLTSSLTLSLCKTWIQAERCFVNKIDQLCHNDDYAQMKLDFVTALESYCPDYVTEAPFDDLLTVLPQATPNLNSEII